ncbi:hypothetical protein LCGC14_0208280 [marine sediment metagenome]|uniref:Uncharacterized protein n=1 Tax=marine sediment metagenome TaxID=412755 RepID=A0A0F9UXW5_9ZZZZ
MNAFRFSRRDAPSPRDWEIHAPGSKRVTIRPTRPEGTPKGKQQHKQQQHEELQQEQWFSIEIVGNRNNCTAVHDSSYLPPEGILYSGQRNYPLNFRGSVTSSGTLLGAVRSKERASQGRPSQASGPEISAPLKGSPMYRVQWRHTYTPPSCPGERSA